MLPFGNADYGCYSTVRDAAACMVTNSGPGEALTLDPTTEPLTFDPIRTRRFG